mgnify:FL=1
MKDIDKKNRVFINAVDIFVVILCLCCAGVGLFVTIYDYFEEPGQTFDVFVVIFGASIFLGAIILILSIRKTAVFGADGIEARRSHKIFFIRTEKIPYSEICKIELNYTSRFGWYAKIYYGSSIERKTINIDISGNGTKLLELFVKYIPKVNYFMVDNGRLPSDYLELLYKLHIHDKRNVL